MLNPSPLPIRLIYRAEERSIPPHVLWPQLDALETAIAAQDVRKQRSRFWRSWCRSGKEPLLFAVLA